MNTTPLQESIKSIIIFLQKKPLFSILEEREKNKFFTIPIKNPMISSTREDNLVLIHYNQKKTGLHLTVIKCSVRSIQLIYLSTFFIDMHYKTVERLFTLCETLEVDWLVSTNTVVQTLCVCVCVYHWPCLDEYKYTVPLPVTLALLLS